MSGGPNTDRTRVLVVEDEPLVAMMIESMLEDVGYVVVATAPSVSAGLAAVDENELDLAILDMTLGRDSSFPIADALQDRGVPFVFASGYDARSLPDKHNTRQVLSKPFTLKDLKSKLAAIGFHQA